MTKYKIQIKQPRDFSYKERPMYQTWKLTIPEDPATTIIMATLRKKSTVLTLISDRGIDALFGASRIAFVEGYYIESEDTLYITASVGDCPW